MQRYQRTRPLLKDDLAAAVSLSAAAFQNTSSYAAIVPDDDARKQFLAWLFERNYQFALEHGVARVVECDVQRRGYASLNVRREIVGFYLFERPGTPSPSLLVLVRWGFLGFPFRFGLGATARLLRLKSWFEAKEREIVGDRAIAKLERVTVLPARQGRGVGSVALAAAMSEADAEKLAVLLFTQEERNVRFYAKLGFEVVADEICPVGDFRNWAMIREPRS